MKFEVSISKTFCVKTQFTTSSKKNWYFGICLVYKKVRARCWRLKLQNWSQTLQRV